MRDNALAVALKRLGHSVTLIPLYTPLRTDAPSAGTSEVYYGGVNVYLQHASRLFRHTPRILDALFDRAWLLNAAGKYGAQTPPEKLYDFTLDVLQGEDGNATKELDRLIGFLKDTIQPQVISLPNLMFIGMARTFRRELGVPVVCELTGEDIFLDAMKEHDRHEVQRVIRARCADVTRFVATSEYYAGTMSGYLDIPHSRIDVVYPGVSRDFISDAARPSSNGRAPTVGYLARIAPEKGLPHLMDAIGILRRISGMEKVRLKVAGYLGSKDEPWFRSLQQRIASEGLSDCIEYVGEVDRDGKLAMLDSIDVFSVPAAHPEPKGIYILEALARGVPVVQPEFGSFPELVRLTNGGLLTPAGDANALALALADLLNHPQQRIQLGEHGRAAVESGFTDDHMAANMLKVYEVAMKEEQNEARSEDVPVPVMPHGGRGGVGGASSLVVDDVWKEYPTPGEPLVALRGVAFEISNGQTLAIVGPSGSGKSTLLNILGTLDHPTRGAVRFGGLDPFAMKGGDLAHFRSGKIGFIFQDHHLLPQCTAVENVMVAKLAAGRVTDTDAKRANELLGMVGLADRAKHLPSELSGGERQRVAIARALMNGPQLLLCDEPTGNLDTKASHAVGELLLRLAAETNAILITVTHSPALAAMFGRQMSMTDGVLVEGPLELTSAPIAPSPSGRGLG
jgi:ABC-type lipoprotein export system ATPase subunit/glycosyltransferase involved in cell wall biosynthesis